VRLADDCESGRLRLVLSVGNPIIVDDFFISVHDSFILLVLTPFSRVLWEQSGRSTGRLLARPSRMPWRPGKVASCYANMRATDALNAQLRESHAERFEWEGRSIWQKRFVD
jgi:hypothetical protein